MEASRSERERVASQTERERIRDRSERGRIDGKYEREIYDILSGIFFAKEVHISLDILSRRVMQKKGPNLIPVPI